MQKGLGGKSVKLRKVRGKRSGVKAVIFTIFWLWELTERAKTNQKSFKGHDSAISFARPPGSKITQSINTPDTTKPVSERSYNEIHSNRIEDHNFDLRAFPLRNAQTVGHLVYRLAAKDNALRIVTRRAETLFFKVVRGALASKA